MLATQAVAQYMQAKEAEAGVTGVPPQLNAGELLQQLQVAIAESVTPPPKEVVKERQKQAEKAQGGK